MTRTIHIYLFALFSLAVIAMLASAPTHLRAGEPASVYLPFVSKPYLPITRLVSVASDGTQSNSLSAWPSISADGRYVAFESMASNLVSNDTNELVDIFVRDWQTGETVRGSVSSDGAQANSWSYRPSISVEGRYVAFTSFANNLVSDDANNREDVFVHDRQTGVTTRVSVASDGTEANSSSLEPSISDDGRYVAFVSYATNLVPGDTNAEADVFVHDRQTRETIRVSVSSDGAEGNLRSSEPDISGDGRHVTFASWAGNLVGDDSNSTWDVFVHDRLTGVTTRVSMASDGTEVSAGSFQNSISADGRTVAFESAAPELAPGDTSIWRDVFVRELPAGPTMRISAASDGAEGNEHSFEPSIFGDGRYVAFTSSASNLVSDDTNGTGDVFVLDRNPQ